MDYFLGPSANFAGRMPGKSIRGRPAKNSIASFVEKSLCVLAFCSIESRTSFKAALHHAGYCYRRSGVVIVSVSLSVCVLGIGHTGEQCKNEWTDQYGVWREQIYVSSRNRVFGWGAYRCHVVNMMKWYVCGGGAVLWQISLTSFHSYYRQNAVRFRPRCDF